MKPHFCSSRERRLWILALSTLVAIYATLALPLPLAEVLATSGVGETLFFVGFLLVLAMIAGHGVFSRPRATEVVVALGVIAVYLIAFARMTTAAERTHLVEYSVLAIVVHAALRERIWARDGWIARAPGWGGEAAAARNGAVGRVRIAATAWVVTVTAGVVDEGVQLFLPNRVFDWFDMFSNAVAATIAISATSVLSWARRRVGCGRE